MLADARQVKNLPGRPKRDPSDSSWLAQCFERGSVRPCFVAAPESARPPPTADGTTRRRLLPRAQPGSYFRARSTYLTLNPRRLRLLQDWVGQFHTYWGSDEASFENYQGLPRNGPASPIAVSRHCRQEREVKKFVVLTYGFVPPTAEV